MTLDLNDEQLKAVISGAIVAHLSPESREKLIADAVKAAMVPDQYDKKTPLMRAFAYSVEQIASHLVTEKLENNAEFRQRLDSMIEDAIKKSLDTDREKIVGQMASAITSWLTKERY